MLAGDSATATVRDGLDYGYQPFGSAQRPDFEIHSFQLQRQFLIKTFQPDRRGVRGGHHPSAIIEREVINKFPNLWHQFTELVADVGQWPSMILTARAGSIVLAAPVLHDGQIMAQPTVEAERDRHQNYVETVDCGAADSTHGQPVVIWADNTTST
jgi:hypothetical protein